MTTPNKVLAVASREIGYNRWDDEAEGTKYGRWYADHTNSPYFGTSGVPYCNMFTSWVLAQAGVKEPAPGHFAYTPYCLNAYRNIGNGVGVRDGRPGDLVFFDWDDDGVVDHIGIIEVAASWGYQTIEGNTSAGAYGSQGNGGGVYRRTRGWDSGISAVVRPQYAGTSSAHNPGTTTGYQINPDGYWGIATTRAWQLLQGTTQDGIVSDQDVYWRDQNPGLTTGWEWVENPTEGSQLIGSLQNAWGLTPQDNLAGPQLFKFMQDYYGSAGIHDGRFDDASPGIIAMQNAINGSLAKRGIK
ncbi:CHAP domain-containing protein [Actinomycetaceae bacterium WB03_NA08]|uniref:CHAP domain-containing protein n=1 Tax=Scrofimicrobium canadense TaxID=2652290 RepID=A0A6N7W9Z0_9ACTO|nr:CHAP domain-containing protein [Scrofimicrobium canadense]MSS84958.1 CHAP domain-containing protein [Scrofimicrobium canadense]